VNCEGPRIGDLRNPGAIGLKTDEPSERPPGAARQTTEMTTTRPAKEKKGTADRRGLPALDEVNPLKGKPQGCRRDETSPTGVQARREEGVRATGEPWTC